MVHLEVAVVVVREVEAWSPLHLGEHLVVVVVVGLKAEVVAVVAPERHVDRATDTQQSTRNHCKQKTTCPWRTSDDRVNQSAFVAHGGVVMTE